jgi:hypothetical protein
MGKCRKTGFTHETRRYLHGICCGTLTDGDITNAVASLGTLRDSDKSRRSLRVCHGLHTELPLGSRGPARPQQLSATRVRDLCSAADIYIYTGKMRPPLWSSGQSSWLQIQVPRVRFPALPDFLGSSGCGTESTQPHEDK